jgi:hypothetical protein
MARRERLRKHPYRQRKEDDSPEEVRGYVYYGCGEQRGAEEWGGEFQALLSLQLTRVVVKICPAV